MGGEEGGDDSLAFVPVNRTIGEDETPIQRDEARGPGQHAGLHLGKAPHLVGRLRIGDVRVAPDRAGRRTGSVEEHGVEAPVRAEVFERPLMSLGHKTEPVEIGLEPLHARGRKLAGRDRRAGLTELGGLAAGRGTEIGGSAAGEVAEKLDGKRGGRILHPPSAIVKAGKLGHRPVQRVEPHGRGTDHASAERVGPAFRIALHRQVDGSRMAVGLSNGSGLFRPILRAQALHQPGRAIDIERQDGRRLARHPAQNGIHQPLEAAGAGIGLGRGDGEIDGGRIRHVQKADLRSPHMQDMAERGGIGRQRTVEPRRDLGFERAAKAKGRRQDRLDKGPVAQLQLAKMRVAVIRVRQAIERSCLIDDGRQEFCRHLARFQARPCDRVPLLMPCGLCGRALGAGLLRRFGARPPVGAAPLDLIVCRQMPLRFSS